MTDQNWWTCIQVVSPSLVFEQIRTTDKNHGWTSIQGVSPFSVFVLIRTTNKNGWTLIQWVSSFLVVKRDLNHYKWPILYLDCKLLCFLILSITLLTDFQLEQRIDSLSKYLLQSFPGQPTVFNKLCSPHIYWSAKFLLLASPYLSYHHLHVNSTTHLHGEHLLEKQTWRWQICGVF